MDPIMCICWSLVLAVRRFTIYSLLFSVYGTGNFDSKNPAAQPRVGSRIASQPQQPRVHAAGPIWVLVP